ncbi:MAG: exopolysaccharide biosynthesis polyprenyl glycosylphosphotransferase [Verrucomicrobiales bacterium]|jgi:exopolysaccharide biosynthesis polyprenyl glycosylphosphotransferase|nr:exopolysaccharide biosynthesis polyprenyl glycosylphosphotransferase [Verrucomicrobiales bacterium]
MLRRDKQLRTQIYQLKDAAMFVLALWVAHFIRSSGNFSFLERQIEDFDQFVWLFLIIIPGVPLVLESQGFYNRPLFCKRRQTAWILLKSCVITTMGIIVVMFLFKSLLARSVIMLFGAISFLIMMLKEELLQWGYRSRFAQLQMQRRVLLVGSHDDTARMRAELALKGTDSLVMVADLDLNQTSISELVRLLHELSINTVILNGKHTFFGQIEKAIQACEIEGVEAWLVADFFQTQISRTSFDEFYGRPVLVFRSAPEASWQGVAKQLLDFFGAVFLLVVLSPVLLLVGLTIKLTSPGPIFFRQKRCGVNGHPFTMLKFRSMVTNAEQRKEELRVLNEMDGPVFKLTNDPRVTPIGRFIRKYSLDEFPQLFNVIRGEMSLVGPRPLPVDEVERFDDPAHRRRLSVKPGLTCLWQVSGRNNVKNFKDWVRLDLEYIDNWSIWLDIKILWLTIPVVVAGTGAK